MATAAQVGLIFVILFAFVNGQGVPCKDRNKQVVTTCGKCLWFDDCEWCPDRLFQDQPAVGCVKKGSYQCNQKPLTSIPRRTLLRAEPLQRFSKPYIQITPQQIRLTTTPGKEEGIDFSVALADNPVDMYFVMDLSGSMNSSLQNLRDTSIEMARDIGRLTEDYTLGFGSYSDKPTAPFAQERETYIRDGYPPPYAFKHQLSLTPDSTVFMNAVRNANLAGNVDSPESGLDALVQAIACKSSIGWRLKSRKVIIVITDQEMHYAYDGKFAGISEPNDLSCHLGRSGEYEAELDFDYPSFGQIRELMHENSVSVIFAVPYRKLTMYKELSVYLQNIDHVAEFSSDPGSLKTVVTRQYRAIKSSMIVGSTASSEAIEVDLGSECSDFQKNEDVLICKGVKEGQEIPYSARIKIREEFCEAEKNGGQVNIDLGGFKNDRLNVFVECEECDCGRVDIGSSVCSGRGDLVCGGCNCRPGYVGKLCECDLSGTADDLESLNKKCRADNTTQIECSGNGECRCGSCECDSAHVGPFCECEKAQCPVTNGEICNGHGECGLHCTSDDPSPKCSCFEGWSGLDCSCPTSTESCEDAISGRVCMGRGTCSCGACDCDYGYEGKYCQISEVMSTCEKLEPCVKAATFSKNVTDSELTAWEDECFDNTHSFSAKIFGTKIRRSCLLDFNVTDEADSKYVTMGYSKDQDCDGIMDELMRMEAENEQFQDEAIGRGDVQIERARKRSSKGMLVCEARFGGCKTNFYHTDVESDDHFDPAKRGITTEDLVLIEHRKLINEEDNTYVWSPQVRCSEIPVEMLMGASGGILLTIVLIGLIAGLVIVNLNDLRAWKRYVALREANEARLGEHQNPLYEGQATTFKNPAFEHTGPSPIIQ